MRKGNSAHERGIPEVALTPGTARLAPLTMRPEPDTVPGAILKSNRFVTRNDGEEWNRAMRYKHFGKAIALAAVLVVAAAGALAQDWREGRPPEGGMGPGGPPPGGPMGRIEDMDTDQDGKVTSDEFLKASLKGVEGQFNRMDENADDVLSKAEMEKRPGPRNGQPRNGSGTQDFTPPPPPPDGGRGRHGDGPPQFSDCDKNADGSVTLEEFTTTSTTRIKARFTKLDENEDGSLDEQEIENARPPRGQGPGGPPPGAPQY